MSALHSPLKHTAGPWAVTDTTRSYLSIIAAPDGRLRWRAVACLDSAGGTLAPDEIRANARLIAAAPELLEALKLAINTVECASIDVATGEELPWYRNAKAVIAKATEVL
jgi:hypothetical protein